MEARAATQGRTFDLLVVGGGIHGAWIARDAALRGLSVLLVEKEDWGWATSARSSKLAHGGLRYLELLEFGLVHEALQERERLLAQAPHLVHPLRFVYPIYPDVASRRAVRVGLWLYDILSHGKSLPKRRYLRRDAVLAAAPGLNPEGLTGGATFHDGQIQSVERLIAELVWDARRMGAVTLNHTKVTGLRIEAAEQTLARDAGVHRRRVVGATLEHAGGTFDVDARLVINAAGAWVDDVLAPLRTAKPLIRRTKGIHVVVPRLCEVALIVKTRRDGRTFFIMPWQGRSVIGTTDTDFHGDAGDAQATPEEVTYLLDEARRYFPNAALAERDVLYTYAGVRALVNEEGLSESNVTRRHLIHAHGDQHVDGILTLQGGKITTARSLAEEVVDRAALALGKPALAKSHPTRDAGLPGGPLVPWTAFRSQAVAAARADLRLPQDAAEHLVDTYGARWRTVASCAGEAGRAKLAPNHPHIVAEVHWAVREEQAATLADFMVRRTGLGLCADGEPRATAAVLRVLASLLGWDRAECARQQEDYLRQVRHLAVPGRPAALEVAP